MTKKILNKRQINRIAGLGARSGVDRQRWLAGIRPRPPEAGAVVTGRNRRRAQLLADLTALNVFVEGEPAARQPLIRLLRNLRRHAPDPRPLSRLEEDAVRRVTALRREKPPSVVLQKAVFRDDTVSAVFVAMAVEAGRSVCRLEVPRLEAGRVAGKPARGTGFLLGPRHVLTNWHVLISRDEGEPEPGDGDLAAQAAATRAAFDFDRPDDLARASVVGAARCVAFDRGLDFAVLELEQATRRKPVAIAPRPLVLQEGAIAAANVIQHPWGRSKRYAIRNNLVHETTDDAVFYFSDTEQGSSGSPVFDDSWQVIALHRGSEQKVVDFMGTRTTWLNFGVPIHRVKTVLEADAALWNAITAGTPVP